MAGQFGRRFLAFIALIAVLAVGGAAVYQLGLTAGVAQGVGHAASAATQIVIPYGYGWHTGVGFFDFLVTLFFLFLVFGLFRAVVFGGRGHRGGRPWGHERFETWHRQAHGDQPPPAGGDAESGATSR